MTKARAVRRGPWFRTAKSGCLEWGYLRDGRSRPHFFLAPKKKRCRPSKKKACGGGAQCPLACGGREGPMLYAPAQSSCRVVGTLLFARLLCGWSTSAQTLTCIGWCPDRRYGGDFVHVDSMVSFFPSAFGSAATGPGAAKPYVLPPDRRGGFQTRPQPSGTAQRRWVSLFRRAGARPRRQVSALRRQKLFSGAEPSSCPFSMAFTTAW